MSIPDAGERRSDTGDAAPLVDRRARRSAIIGTALGNLLEWYDFAVYAALSSILGPLFFPATSPAASLLASLSVFAVGYVARPIGAILFGWVSDTRGRRAALVLVIVLMGVSTVGMGFLPTYAAVGVVAPILLVIARALQGISIGGEFATATTYLVELAPPRRRGAYGAIIFSMAGLGFALGLGVVVLLNAVVTPRGVSDGWWRAAFLLGVPLLLVGRYLRRRAMETPAFHQAKAAADDLAPRDTAPDSRRSRVARVVQVIGLTMAVGVGSYTLLGYAVPYLLVIAKQPPSVAYPSALIATVVGAGFIQLGGHLADRFGRKPVMLAAVVGIAVLAMPYYLLMSAGGFWAALAGQLLFWLPVGVALGILPTLLAEMFPARTRTTAMGVPYALGVALFSGTAPLISNLLVTSTGNVLAPAWYLIGFGVITAGVVVSLRETAWAELRTH